MKVNKIINLDDSITDRFGNIIDEKLAVDEFKNYVNLEPNKMLNYDGSITDLNGNPIDLSLSGEKFKSTTPVFNLMLNQNDVLTDFDENIIDMKNATNKFKTMVNPSVNAFKHDDNKVYDFDGFEIDMSNVSDKFKTYSLIDNKMLNYDGSITDLNLIPSDYFTIINSSDLDLQLKSGYYKIIDNSNNSYIALVDENLNILDNEVIKDEGGYIRLQGVEFPCRLIVKNYTSSTGNTKQASTELESNFPSPVAIKKVVR